MSRTDRLARFELLQLLLLFSGCDYPFEGVSNRKPPAQSEDRSWVDSDCLECGSKARHERNHNQKVVIAKNVNGS